MVPKLSRTEPSITHGKAPLDSPPMGEHRVLTNLEIRHVVLQQSPGSPDILLSAHKDEGNHALMKYNEERN